MTHLEAEVVAALERHGIEAGEALVADLTRVALNEAWWDDARVVEYVGTIVPASVRAWCSRYGVPRRVLMPANAVVLEQQRRRGQGWRKDDHEK